MSHGADMQAPVAIAIDVQPRGLAEIDIETARRLDDLRTVTRLPYRGVKSPTIAIAVDGSHTQGLRAEMGIPAEQAGEWLTGRTHVPVAVAAWLEALVKAHRSVPKPDILESKAILGHLASAMDSSQHSSGILQ